MERIATPEAHVQEQHDGETTLEAAVNSWRRLPTLSFAAAAAAGAQPAHVHTQTQSTDIRTDSSVTPVDQLQDQGIISSDDVTHAMDPVAPAVPQVDAGTSQQEVVAEHTDGHQFSNRFTMFLSALGAAVGAGSVWRFPRVLALNGTPRGAGAFLFAWVFCLMLYSVPTSIAEYGLGKKTRVGLVRTYQRILGRYSLFIAGFTILVNMFITFYYSVLTGWTFYWLYRSIFFELPVDEVSSRSVFSFFENSIYLPVLLHFAATIIAGLACIRGVKTIEHVNSVLVPMLLVILALVFVRAVTLGPGAWRGLVYMFTPDFSVLAKPSTWLESLKQNAFDTGAGFGLFLTYANSIKPSQPIAAQATLTPVVNNVVSLLCGATMFAVCFALLGAVGTDEQVLNIMQTSGPAGTGLTFLWIPVLFSKMPGGVVLSRIFCSLFFLGIAFAALSSMIGLLNLPLKAMTDAGVKQSVAVVVVCVICMVGGLPSAISIQVLANQDFVWSGALMFCCLGIASLVFGYGPKRFVTECIRPTASALYRWTYVALMNGVVPVVGIFLLVTWIIESVTESTEWYNPFGSDSLMTCLVQWFLAFAVVAIANIVYVLVANRRATIAQTKDRLEQFTLYGVSDTASVASTKQAALPTTDAELDLQSPTGAPPLVPTSQDIQHQLKEQRAVEMMDATSPV